VSSSTYFWCSTRRRVCADELARRGRIKIDALGRSCLAERAVLGTAPTDMATMTWPST